MAKKISEEKVRTFDATEEDGMKAWVLDQIKDLRLDIADRRKDGEKITSRWQFQVRPTKVNGRWEWQVWLVEHDANGEGPDVGTVAVRW